MLKIYEVYGIYTSVDVFYSYIQGILLISSKLPTFIIYNIVLYFRCIIRSGEAVISVCSNELGGQNTSFVEIFQISRKSVPLQKFIGQIIRSNNALCTIIVTTKLINRILASVLRVSVPTGIMNSNFEIICHKIERFFLI